MQIFVNYKNSSYIFCWFAHDVTAARLVFKNKSVLLWDLNSISSELFKLIVYCIDHQQDRLVSLLQTKNSSLWFVHPCFAFSEKSPELQQSYLWIQKLMNAMRSFLHFHFISAVHIWFISYITNNKLIMNNKILVQRSHPLVICGALPLLFTYYSGLITFVSFLLKLQLWLVITIGTNSL